MGVVHIFYLLLPSDAIWNIDRSSCSERIIRVHSSQVDYGTTAICTWFVGDDAEKATFSPQLGARSDASEVQAVYWRCTVCFYASSIVANPGRRHIFFTNTAIPVVDGVDVEAVLRLWEVEIVRLPITYRLPAGTVQSWGSQFYTFNVIDYLAKSGTAARYLILDSDCLWMRSVGELEAAIDKYGVLSYEIGFDEHPDGTEINGVSRSALARFLGTLVADAPDTLPYFGGEFFAATHSEVCVLSERLKLIWPEVLALTPGAPREDGHMLSILFALGKYEIGTANQFIRRMWTTFKHHNLRASDMALTIWHMPAEKKAGFGELFTRISASAGGDIPHPTALGFGPSAYARAMGFPKRRPAKLVRDLSRKILEKLPR